jgi:hypothetical protein
MKRHFITLFAVMVLFAVLFSGCGNGDGTARLFLRGYIQDGSGDLQTGIYSVPVVYDWNSDGKKDMLVGQRYIDDEGVSHGYVSYFKNIGTDARPVFDGFTFLAACASVCTNLDVEAGG